jgi:hypothetical protein
VAKSRLGPGICSPLGRQKSSGYIWSQLSEAAGLDEGELLSPKAFADKWNNGEGWRVDSDGKIINLWDKDKSGAANKAITFMSNLPVDEKGVVWAADTLKELSVSSEEAQSIKADKLWENSEYSNIIAKSQTFEAINSYGAVKWATENNGKVFVPETGTGAYIVKSQGTTSGNMVLYDPVTKKDMIYNFATKRIVPVGTRVVTSR